MSKVDSAPPMHAADTARREHRDPRQRRDLHRGRHGGPCKPPLHQQRGHVAPRGLRRVMSLARQALQRISGDADHDAAVDQGDRRRHSTSLAHHRLDLAGHGEILWVGHPMRDDRRFQGDDGAPCRQRGRNLVRDRQEGGQRWRPGNTEMVGHGRSSGDEPPTRSRRAVGAREGGPQDEKATAHAIAAHATFHHRGGHSRPSVASRPPRRCAISRSLAAIAAPGSAVASAWAKAT